MLDFLSIYGYPGIFAASFLAATILPLGSEIVLSALLLNGLNPSLLVITATAGNVLGALVNYGVGYYGKNIVKGKTLDTAGNKYGSSLKWIKKYGSYTLLLAWAPIIGDPLTVAAGIIRVNIIRFLLLVTAGKLLRYIILTFIIVNSS